MGVRGLRRDSLLLRPSLGRILESVQDLATTQGWAYNSAIPFNGLKGVTPRISKVLGPNISRYKVP